MDEVDNESLNMGAIVVLISHDHERPISKRLSVMISLTHLESKDLDYVLDLSIVLELGDRSISHINELSSQGKHSIFISSYNLDSTHGQSLG